MGSIHRVPPATSSPPAEVGADESPARPNSPAHNDFRFFDSSFHSKAEKTGMSVIGRADFRTHLDRKVPLSYKLDSRDLHGVAISKYPLPSISRSYCRRKFRQKQSLVPPVIGVDSRFRHQIGKIIKLKVFPQIKREARKATLLKTENWVLGTENRSTFLLPPLRSSAIPRSSYYRSVPAPFPGSIPYPCKRLHKDAVFHPHVSPTRWSPRSPS
jgi:hypothetical protein